MVGAEDGGSGGSRRRRKRRRRCGCRAYIIYRPGRGEASAGCKSGDEAGRRQGVCAERKYGGCWRGAAGAAKDRGDRRREEADSAEVGRCDALKSVSQPPMQYRSRRASTISLLRKVENTGYYPSIAASATAFSLSEPYFLSVVFLFLSDSTSRFRSSARGTQSYE